MKKQWILALGGLGLVLLLFFFGSTVAPKTAPVGTPAKEADKFDISHFIEDSKETLTPAQLLTLTELENSVKRGDVVPQQITAYTQLANYWRDSLQVFEPYIFYLSEAAKLDKSEKNLTFAAQLILDNLRGEQDEAKLNWKAAEAVSLFETAIERYPDNDDYKVGLGSVYIFGKGKMGDPQETMKGIQQLLSVVRKDSTNMKAQLMLGVGGYVSGQYDKGIERLLKVVKAQPDNLEAVAFLADTYAAKGDKENAIKWYQVSKRMVNDARYSKEVDERIKLLK